MASAFLNRVTAAVAAAQVTNGQAVLYAPLLEFIIQQAFLACSTDAAISGADQTVFLNAYNASLSDPAP